MGQILQAPHRFENSADYQKPAIFLAGGISSCDNWQLSTARSIAGKSCLNVFNPRREGDFAKTGDEAAAQIRWEYEHLNAAEMVLFWFPSTSVCPIALYELGRIIHSNKILYIGVDFNYPRRFDVIEQAWLASSTYVIYNTLDSMVEEIIG